MCHQKKSVGGRGHGTSRYLPILEVTVATSFADFKPMPARKIYVRSYSLLNLQDAGCWLRVCRLLSGCMFVALDPNWRRGGAGYTGTDGVALQGGARLAE